MSDPTPTQEPETTATFSAGQRFGVKTRDEPAAVSVSHFFSTSNALALFHHRALAYLYSNLLVFFGFPVGKSTWYLLVSPPSSFQVDWFQKGTWKHCRLLIGQREASLCLSWVFQQPLVLTSSIIPVSAVVEAVTEGVATTTRYPKVVLYLQWIKTKNKSQVESSCAMSSTYSKPELIPSPDRYPGMDFDRLNWLIISC